jgi:hypothetical protein
MVHKDQQDLVRQILAPYSRKLQEDVTGIRENDLVRRLPLSFRSGHPALS